MELLGAAGLILPAVTGIAPILTPLAAAGLAVMMLLAAFTHVRRKEPLATIDGTCRKYACMNSPARRCVNAIPEDSRCRSISPCIRAYRKGDWRSGMMPESLTTCPTPAFAVASTKWGVDQGDGVERGLGAGRVLGHQVVGQGGIGASQLQELLAVVASNDRTSAASAAPRFSKMPSAWVQSGRAASGFLVTAIAMPSLHSAAASSHRSPR
jgi:hypothetical protein